MATDLLSVTDDAVPHLPLLGMLLGPPDARAGAGPRYSSFPAEMYEAAEAAGHIERSGNGHGAWLLTRPEGQAVALAGTQRLRAQQAEEALHQLSAAELVAKLHAAEQSSAEERVVLRRVRALIDPLRVDPRRKTLRVHDLRVALGDTFGSSDDARDRAADEIVQEAMESLASPDGMGESVVSS